MSQARSISSSPTPLEPSHKPERLCPCNLIFNPRPSIILQEKIIRNEAQGSPKASGGGAIPEAMKDGLIRTATSSTGIAPSNPSAKQLGKSWERVVTYKPE